jgi:hypothetical protein
MPGCGTRRGLDRRDQRRRRKPGWLPRAGCRQGADDLSSPAPASPDDHRGGHGQSRRHSACAAARQVPGPASRAAGPATGKPAPPPRYPGDPGSMAGGQTLTARRPGHWRPRPAPHPARHQDPPGRLSGSGARCRKSAKISVQARCTCRSGCRLPLDMDRNSCRFLLEAPATGRETTVSGHLLVNANTNCPEAATSVTKCDC